MKLIDADKLLEKFWGSCKNCLSEDDIADLIDTALTIDPESLREHGQWIMQQDNTGVCSNCHRLDHIDPLAKYCRYCGAKMDGED